MGRETRKAIRGTSCGSDRRYPNDGRPDKNLRTRIVNVNFLPGGLKPQTWKKHVKNNDALWGSLVRCFAFGGIDRWKSRECNDFYPDVRRVAAVYFGIVFGAQADAAHALDACCCDTWVARSGGCFGSRDPSTDKAGQGGGS